MENNYLLQSKIAALDAFADILPAVIIIHNHKTTAVEYMCSKGLNQLGCTLQEVKEMGTEYYTRFFNPEDTADYVPKIFGLLERNNDEETVSFFQQVRFSEAQDWSWHFSTTKIFFRGEDGKPTYTITLAFPVDSKHHLTTKVSRLLEENIFLRKHYEDFAQLGRREKEILRLVALGKSSTEIADELFIAVATVETHRRNVRQKLNIHTMYEVSQYARAFDLI